jgi:hypothetical protein
MTRPQHTRRTALGFRVKSGWTVAVLVAGPAADPVVLDRRIVTLSDPAVAGSSQPYHAGTGLAETDPGRFGSMVQAVERYAGNALWALFAGYRADGHALAGVGIVVGTDGDPERIANQHIQAHAREGRLFRRVLEEAARAERLPCAILVERDAYRTAAAALGGDEDGLRQRVAGMRPPAGGPWRAVDKLAALAAWAALA